MPSFPGMEGLFCSFRVGLFQRDFPQFSGLEFCVCVRFLCNRVADTFSFRLNRNVCILLFGDMQC